MPASSVTRLSPLEFEEVTLEDRKRVKRSVKFDTDEGPRRETSFEALSALKPAFRPDGVSTAGNSSQTSDGAAAVLLMSRSKMEQYGLKPLARYVGYAYAGVPPEMFGIGPVTAIPKALKLAGIQRGDLKVIELNEAFAAQSLAVIHQAELNPEITNVNGGAIALGHPLGCTGAAPHRQPHQRVETARRRLRTGDDVRRWRHGRRRHLRSGVTSANGLQSLAG